MRRTTRALYQCVYCGEPMASCVHARADAPGWCNGEPQPPPSQIGHHDRCPGHAIGHPPNSCPCSCHPKATDEEIEETTNALLSLQRELERKVESCSDATR